MRKTPVMPGTKWGTLTVIRAISKNEASHVRWEVKCDCGVQIQVWGYHLVKGEKVSCGRKGGHLNDLPKDSARSLPPPIPEKKTKKKDSELDDLGLFIAGEVGRDPERLVRTFLYALEDLNQHYFHIIVEREWEKLKGEGDEKTGAGAGSGNVLFRHGAR